MKILIWDDKTKRCEAHFKTVCMAAGELKTEVAVTKWTSAVAPGADEGIGKEFDLLLLHGSNAGAAKKWIAENKVMIGFTLEYGGGGIKAGVPRSVADDATALDESEMKWILRSSEATDQDTFLFKVRQYWRNHELICALRLLCEAWLMNNGEKEKQHGDILIHAPVNPDDWCDPFVEGFTKLEAAQQEQAIEKQIADLMGNAREKVKAFYHSLRKDGSSHLTRTNVDQLLKDLKAATT